MKKNAHRWLALPLILVAGCLLVFAVIFLKFNNDSNLTIVANQIKAISIGTTTIATTSASTSIISDITSTAAIEITSHPSTTLTTGEAVSHPPMPPLSPKPTTTSSIITVMATTTAITTATTTPSSTESSAEPQSITISPQAIVGLLCYYTTTSTYLKNLGATPVIFQSSGVIINPAGYILTAKHVVDPKWTMQVYTSSTSGDQLVYNFINFDYCDVSIPTLSPLFTVQQIKQWNPYSLLPEPQYKATLYFDPPQGTLTQEQYDEADFSILKITGVADDCSTLYGFDDCDAPSSLPGTFPYVPALLASTPPIGVQLITYGYPVEANSNYGTGRLYLEGAVGNVTSYDTSTYLNNIPLAIRWDAGDILGGRSGSGIFWNGYLVGTLYEKNNDQYWSQSITIQAIQQILANNGLGNLLEAH